MIIGGILKNSFIDYPSKISCVVFTAGCNFKCPYCHNPELVKRSSKPTIDTKEVFAFLKKRKPLLDSVVITGGEPTLQEDLVNFCEQLKAIGYPVKLDSNGTRPKIIKHLIDKKLIDYIAMDIKTDPDQYSPDITTIYHPDDVYTAIRFIKGSGIPHEFRTTCVKSIVDKNAIRKIVRLINGADLYVLQKVSIENKAILNPNYFKTHDWHYDEQSFEDFRSYAARFSKNVIIR
jgi:pyruvate formate lyase activating enzyme